MTDSIDIGRIVIEEFLRIKADDIVFRFPASDGIPRDVYDVLIAMRGEMSIYAADMILSLNSRWN